MIILSPVLFKAENTLHCCLLILRLYFISSIKLFRVNVQFDDRQMSFNSFQLFSHSYTWQIQKRAKKIDPQEH